MDTDVENKTQAEVTADETDQKRDVRNAYRAARHAFAPELRKKANKLILAKLAASATLARAKTVLIYAATDVEVNLDDLIGSLTRAGKRVAVPRLTKTPGVMTLWAVRHVDALVAADGAKVRTPDITRAVPIEPHDVDVALVPGVAFTATMGRLGQGGGYYDRLLPRLRADAAKIGIAFDVQIAASVPIDDHDVPMDAVLTETAAMGNAALFEPLPTPAPVGVAPSDSSENAESAPKVPSAQIAAGASQ